MGPQKLKLRKFIKEIREISENKGWSGDWSAGGCYLHLEVSEFIEGLRGKGDPIEEAGDVLFVLLRMLDWNGIRLEDVIAAGRRKCKKVQKKLTKKVKEQLEGADDLDG